MEENKICALCGKDIPEESLYNDVTHHGKKITLCRDCNKAVSTALSADPTEEKAAARKELESLIQGEAASQTAVLYIREEVLKQKTEGNDDPEEEEEEKKSPYSFALRFLAWVSWLAGLYTAYKGANVITGIGLLNMKTEFSLADFLGLFIPWLIFGALLMGLATVMDKVTDTNHKMNELLRIQKGK